MKRFVFPLIFFTILTSCAEVASTLVEDQLQHGLKSGQTNHQRTKTDDKKLAKQQEQLKKDGKCPKCGGMGRTPDGQYICEACKGTGKYIETNSKQE